MRALRELDRMAGVEREGRKFAHTGARFKIPRVHQAQRSAQRWLPATTFFGSARIRVEGSRSSFDRQQKEEALRKTSARIGLSNHPGSITADTSSIIRRLLESRNAAHAISAANRSAFHAAIPNLKASTRTREALEIGRAALATKAFRTDAPSIHKLAQPPSSVAQREFSRPIPIAPNRNGGASNAGITINSSPTVVINATPAGSNLERDVLSALRAHREELFDQLKRESARRERAQF